MNAVVPFNFKGNQVRSLMIDDMPWFVARDVCECLEVANVSKAVSRLQDEEKLVSLLVISGQNREVLMVNEPGLYRLIFTSNKPEARAFQNWVYHEVLPAIRKTGSYGAMPAMPDMAAMESRLAALESRFAAIPVPTQYPTEAARPAPMMVGTLTPYRRKILQAADTQQGIKLMEITQRVGKPYEAARKTVAVLYKRGLLERLDYGIYRTVKIH
jgi:prophage antirepressor-like protein